MKRTTTILAALAISTIGAHAANLAAAGNISSMTVTGGDYWQAGRNVGAITTTIGNGITLTFLSPRYETILQQVDAGTSTINIEVGGMIDCSNASGNGTGFWLANANSGAYGVINLNGGTFDGSGLTDIQFGRSNSHGLLNISAVTVTFGSTPGWGSAADNAIDFIAGSTGDLTITGADQTYYEGIYTSGHLLYGGSNTDAFADHFSVTGETITVVPEPSALALFVSLCGLGLFIRRRK
jgi:hypothetical protein